MKKFLAGVIVLTLSGCVIPKSLQKAEDRRAIAYYREHALDSAVSTETKKLSDTDVILSGLQACKALERYADP